MYTQARNEGGGGGGGGGTDPFARDALWDALSEANKIELKWYRGKKKEKLES